MTLELILYCIGWGLLGIVFKAAVKFKGVRDKARAVGHDITKRAFLQEEGINLFISFIAMVFCFSLCPILLKWKPWFIDLIQFIFGLFGYMGTDLMLAIFGQSSKRINGLIKDTLSKTI